eukprot:5619524-Pleurochrysis_carterae.AAC.1
MRATFEETRNGIVDASKCQEPRGDECARRELTLLCTIATYRPTRRWESGDGMAALTYHCPSKY